MDVLLINILLIVVAKKSISLRTGIQFYSGKYTFDM